MTGGRGNSNSSAAENNEVDEVLNWIEKNRAMEEKFETAFLEGGYEASSKISDKYKYEYEITAAQMRLVLNEKQKKSHDNRQLNCLVFEDLNNPKFKEFLQSLTKYETIKPNSRYQIVLQRCDDSGGVHWSSIDILANKEALQILHFDSIDSKANSKDLAEILSTIDSPKPISLICSCSEDVQADSHSCSIFALSAALAMSKISNLHSIAREKSILSEDAFSDEDTNNVKQYTVEASDLPANLIKSAQSSEYIRNYEAKHANDDFAKITKKSGKTESISEYAQRHSHPVTVKNAQGVETIKNRNFSIFYKRNRYSNIAQNSSIPSEPKASTSASLLAQMKPTLNAVFDNLRVQEPDATVQPRVSLTRATIDGLQINAGKVVQTETEPQVERPGIRMGSNK